MSVFAGNALGAVPDSVASVGVRRMADSSLTNRRATVVRRLPLRDQDEILWLARCLYSESNLPHEQKLVAWVVRNRVETRYRGETYRDVVLETRQFSAFNEPSERRDHILKLGLDSTEPAWRKVLGIALDVYQADADERPFPVTVRHFYSPISMKGAAAPDWASGEEAVDVTAFDVDPQRFKFFDAVDSSGVGTMVGPSNLAARSHVPHDRIDARKGEIQPRRITRSRMKLTGKVSRPERPVISRPSAERK